MSSALWQNAPTETIRRLHSDETRLCGFPVRFLMKEAQPRGIKVTTLFPAGTDTNFREVQNGPQYMSAKSVAYTINQILELPEDVGDA